jgi:hypothetical protein
MEKIFFFESSDPEFLISVLLIFCLYLKPLKIIHEFLFAIHVSHVTEMLDDVTDRK